MANPSTDPHTQTPNDANGAAEQHWVSEESSFCTMERHAWQHPASACERAAVKFPFQLAL
mgnify:CR=1 FL=1